jgi:leucyl/phenylalanyl-tRNA--protein transferase
LLVGSVGEDFVDYRSWLERHGVDCSFLRVSELLHTARFICTTDRKQAQIASFYAGAMSEAREIELAPLRSEAPLDLVVVSPNDPQAMLRHTQECRQGGIEFVADPSQQLAWSDGSVIRQLIEGAGYLFTNDYEAALVTQKTGWDSGQIMSRVGVRVTTLGRDGVVVERRGSGTVKVPAALTEKVADPTGVGDGFRAGFLAGLAWGLPDERCAQVGCLVATLVLETVGTQEYNLGRSVPVSARRGSATAPRRMSSRTCGPCILERDSADRALARFDRQPRMSPPQEPRPSRYGFDLGEAVPGEDLVGVGADLEPGTLLCAYRNGLFPMGLGHCGREPMGWWSPDHRGILPLDGVRVSRSLRRSRSRFAIRVDTAFETVVSACADPSRSGRWITDAVWQAYQRLHQLGWAHSVECWRDNQLVGGLYGVAVAGLFAGESMFHRDTDASKVALLGLVDLLAADGDKRRLLDVQWRTPHLARLGVIEISRSEYLRRLRLALACPMPEGFADA